ncbi:hypothetical protein FIBSPDRAFT_787821 [Athelia psychrophila]|uniref:RBR-type E3 ubiquitin transferase n=1 Tax=Athelia psychrophila TaxID=1759441 RepID=A0A166KL04_9AGAM|nr:hypothetical protein FIBSPDRAFT_787821 [Fibularhizoctonia sp. CBS 109695]
MALATDYQSELAVFKFLEDDLRSIALANEAQKLHLAEIAAATAPRTVTESKHEHEPQLSDEEIALQLFASESHLALDRAYAELLHSEDASFAISMQAAQRLAAADQKARIDNEFAKKLQATLDQDVNGNHDHDVDADSSSSYQASDPNSKGKGKGKGKAVYLDSPVAGTADTTPPNNASDASATPYPSCGICGDIFQDTYSPMSAAQTANSPKHLSFGLRLPCPGEHPYCVDCISQYISSKLDPDGNGGAKDGRVVFPIRCPECPVDKWTEGIPDTVATKVLAKDILDLWHYQKLLDSLPRYYCPNKSCSALVQVDESATDPQATCPLCSMIMCVPCKVQWHDGYTCEGYQALPAEDRSAEDLLLLRLAKKEKWRRCNKCKRFIELKSGCNHMTCKCGGHFCFKCGADWDTKAYRCTRGAGCQLWEDDDQLLDEDQRGDVARPILPAAPRVPAPVLAPAPPAAHQHVPLYMRDPPPRYENEEFDWMYNPDWKTRMHNFTMDMINTFSCGYCGRNQGSLRDLQAHLRHVRRHPVFSCCGRFFRQQGHYEQHRDSVEIFRDHHDTYVRAEHA